MTDSTGRLRRVRDLLVAQPTALAERAFLLGLGLALCAVTPLASGSPPPVGTFGSVPTLVGVTLVLLAVSEFVPAERTALILALRSVFFGLLAASLAYLAAFVLFAANNAP